MEQKFLVRNFRKMRVYLARMLSFQDILENTSDSTQEFSVNSYRNFWSNGKRSCTHNEICYPDSLESVTIFSGFKSFPVHTLSDSLQIYYFPLWRAD